MSDGSGGGIQEEIEIQGQTLNCLAPTIPEKMEFIV
jgi:hypothetical protein